LGVTATAQAPLGRRLIRYRRESGRIGRSSEDEAAMAEISMTGYLILGILSIRDTSAYEIVEQMGKGVSEVWRRADRQLYDAPKRLVELGLITARKETSAGRRQRTVYSITPAGRTALMSWIETPIQPSAMEFEGLVRLLFADQGDVDALRATLRTIAEQAGVRRDLFVSHANYAIASDGGSVPERAHVFAIVNRYMVKHFNLMIEWAGWALEQVEDWPDSAIPATTHRNQTWQIFRENARMTRNPKRRS